MPIASTNSREPAASAVLCGLIFLGILCSACAHRDPPPAVAPPAAAPDTVVLNDTQRTALQIAIAGRYRFAELRAAVGSLDFDENATVPVFSPYSGRILRADADIGDPVARGAALYTIDSPDLLQAESSLIAAAAAADLTQAALERARDLFAHQGMAQKDYQQAVADEMTAAGALRAARDALRIFGKNEAAIDAVIASRQVDSTLVIHSPVTGRISARAAQPGLLVQPGVSPAPYTVADTSTLWMIAAVPEGDIPQLKVGQPVSVRVAALGDTEFSAKVLVIGAAVDPSTHTAAVRAAIHDPDRRLRPGMLATFVIRIGDSVDSVGIPVKGVVREGDGSMSAWVVGDAHRFTRRNVKIGLQQDGIIQILEGVSAGERVVTDGAILLSNMLYGNSGE